MIKQINSKKLYSAFLSRFKGRNARYKKILAIAVVIYHNHPLEKKYTNLDQEGVLSYSHSEIK